MFYRLITNLQYSPGLIGQVAFYSNRLKKEEFVRRVGLIFSILALTMQAFFIFSPPEPSLASSTNDIVYGGGDKAKMLHVYRNNRDDLGRTDIQNIFHRYGIHAEHLERAQDVTIQSRAENNFYSIGRQSRFSSQIETRIDIPGAAPVYSRPLHAWDSGPYSTYAALYGTNNQGTEFWILKNCGNIVLKTPTPSALPPGLDVEKSIVSPATYKVKRGDEIVYSIRYRNNGQGAAGLMKVEDLIPKYTSFVSANGPFKWVNNGLVHWDHITPDNPYGILGVTDWFHEVNLVVKVSANAPDGTRICNIATISAINGNPDSSPPVCREVEEPEPTAVCTDLEAEKLARDKYKFTAHSNVKDGAKINEYVFDFGDSNSGSVPAQENSNSASIEHIYDKPGTYTIKATLKTSLGDINDKTCVQQITVEEPEGEPQIVHHKEASNLTQEIEDANNTVARAGDRIEYRLVTENLGNADYIGFELPAEDIADILEYADIEELNDAIYDKDKKKLTWPTIDVPAGGKVEKVFVVKVKDPIPQTPVSASDPGSFDLMMSNSYGNDQVQIKLPPSNNKRIENVATSLPNTGIGDNIVTSTFLIGMSTYFYSRNRLITKELKLIKKEFTYG